MFSVGLDEFENLILYSQLIYPLRCKIEKIKLLISRFHLHLPCRKSNTLAPEQKDNRNEVKEIIFGSLLGDAKLEMHPRGLNARFGFIQSLDKKEYFVSV
jgi:hypothetical protein